jgi:hypothetical protein
MEANWRTWAKEDPKQTKCRDVSLQIGWSDDTVLRAMKCIPFCPAPNGPGCLP